MQAIYMTGWAPSPKQPKPATRGSGTVSFQDLERMQRQEDQGSDAAPLQGVQEQPVSDDPGLVK